MIVSDGRIAAHCSRTRYSLGLTYCSQVSTIEKSLRGYPMKFLAFTAGALLAANAIFDAVAKPQYDSVQQQYQSMQCERLGPNAAALLPACIR